VRLETECAEKEVPKRAEVEKPTEPLKVPVAALLDETNREPMSEKRIFSKSQEHALVLRDGYRCSYVDPLTQRRCVSSFKLEKDHVQAWAIGGKSNLANARHLCASHHRRVSFLQYGESSKYAKSDRYP
jgi:hypothetical protein